MFPLLLLPSSVLQTKRIKIIAVLVIYDLIRFVDFREKTTRVAEGVRRHEGLDSDENFSPNICYFVVILRFVAIYAFFGRL